MADRDYRRPFPKARRDELREHRRYDFSGMLDLSTGDLATPPNCLRVCRNFVATERGALKVRGGLVKYNQNQVAGYRDSL